MEALSPLAAGVGECPPNVDYGGDVPLTPVDRLLRTDYSWIVVPSNGVAVSEPDEADQVTITIRVEPSASAPADDGSSPAIGDDLVGANAFVGELSRESGRLLIGSRAIEGRHRAPTVLFVDDEGRIAWPAGCGLEGARDIAAWVQLKGRMGDMLIPLATDRSSPEHQAALAEQERERQSRPAPTTTLDRTQTWSQLPPGSRQIVLGETPSEVVGSLISLPVRVHLPASWRNDSRTLCTRTSIGWGECLRLDAVVEPASQTWLPFNVWMSGTESVEVWLLDERATLDRPITKLATLDGNLLLSLASTFFQDPSRVVALSVSPEAAARPIDQSGVGNSAAAFATSLEDG